MKNISKCVLKTTREYSWAKARLILPEKNNTKKRFHGKNIREYTLAKAFTVYHLYKTFIITGNLFNKGKYRQYILNVLISISI